MKSAVLSSGKKTFKNNWLLYLLMLLVVEDGGEGIVVTYVVVETICLFGAKVMVVAPGLALFRIFGAETCRPSLATLFAAATN